MSQLGASVRQTSLGEIAEDDHGQGFPAAGVALAPAGGCKFVLDELRETPLRRGEGFDAPVALTLGSDVLSRFIVTIDLRSRKLILAMPND